MVRQKVGSNYGVDSIQKLEDLEGIRKRPGMYIGGTDINALNHVVMEAIDNSNDEYLAGYGNQIDVEFTEDGSVIIEDRGRGIPHGKNKDGKETLEILLTKLHAGGKFGGDSSGYRSSGGLHGM